MKTTQLVKCIGSCSLIVDIILIFPPEESSNSFGQICSFCLL